MRWVLVDIALEFLGAGRALWMCTAPLDDACEREFVLPSREEVQGRMVAPHEGWDGQHLPHASLFLPCVLLPAQRTCDRLPAHAACLLSLGSPFSRRDVKLSLQWLRTTLDDAEDVARGTSSPEHPSVHSHRPSSSHAWN